MVDNPFDINWLEEEKEQDELVLTPQAEDLILPDTPVADLFNDEAAQDSVRKSRFINQGVSPDVRIRSLDLQQKQRDIQGFAVPVKVIEGDITKFEAEVDQPEYMDFADRPVTADMLAGTEEGPAFKADEWNLAKTEDQQKSIGDRWAIGQMQTSMANLGWKALYSDLTEEEGKQLKEMESELARMSKISGGSRYDPDGLAIAIGEWFEDIPGTVAEMTPLMLDAVSKSWYSAAAGGAAGSLVPVVGTSLGLAAGMTGGIITDIGKKEAGLAYVEFTKLNDDNGRPFTDAEIKGAAVTVGLANGLIEFAGDKLMAGFASNMFKGMTKKTIRAMLNTPSGKRQIAKVGLLVGNGALVNGGEEALQQVTTEVVDAVLRQTGDIEGKGFKEHLAAIVHAGSAGMKGGIGMVGAMSVAPQVAMQTIQDKQTNKNARVLGTLSGLATDSKTLEKMPARYRQAVETMIQTHGSADTIGVELVAFETFLQDVGISEQQLRQEMPDVADAVERARETQQDVRIEASRFMTDFVKAPEMQKHFQDVRMHPAAPTDREAGVQLEKTKAAIANLAADGVNAPIHSYFQDLLKDVEDPEFANFQAQLLTSFFVKAAQEDPTLTKEDFIAQFNIDVVREDIDDTATANTIAKIRSKKTITDSQVFGPTLQEFMSDPEKTSQDAVEAGYFDSTETEGEQAVTQEEFQAAMESKDPVYAYGQENLELMSERQQMTSLVEVAKNRGIDLEAGTPEDVVAELKGGRLEQAGPSHDATISTRVPTAVKGKENPLTESLTVGYEEQQQDEKSFKKNVASLKSYPGFKTIVGETTKETAERFITLVSDNLRWLHDQVPEATRERSKTWYDGASSIATRWAGRFGVSKPAVAGVLAALSPQKDWFMNVSLAERILEIYTSQQDTVWTPEMDKTAKRMTSQAGSKYSPKLIEKASQDQRKRFRKLQESERRVFLSNKKKPVKLSQLTDPVDIAIWIRVFDETYNDRSHKVVTPEGRFSGTVVSGKTGQNVKTGWGSYGEISKAVSVLLNPTPANISRQMGNQHKVRNFYNNIINSTKDQKSVTIDTHANAAGLMRPLAGADTEVTHSLSGSKSAVTGVGGTYAIYAEAYRRVAAELGILPRELQSITWEAVRGLYSDTFKNAANKKIIDDIWSSYEAGEITADEARLKSSVAAGGITEPAWVGSDPGQLTEQVDSTYLTELSGTEVAGRDPGSDASGTEELYTTTPLRSKGAKTRRLRSLLGGTGRRSDTVSRAFSRRSDGDGRSDRGIVATFTPTEEAAALMESLGITPLVWTETTDHTSFRSAFVESIKDNKFKAAVEIKDLEDYVGLRLFTAEDGKIGFAITPSGDLVSLFKDPSAKVKKVSWSSLLMGVDQGAITCDCFDTVLPGLYGEIGFVATSRIRWNEEHKPDGWDKETFKEYNNGEPDVVFMAYSHSSHKRYQPGDGTLVKRDDRDEEWDPAAKIQGKKQTEFERKYQRHFDGGARGFIDIGKNKDYFKITLTGQANLSTFLHESGHMFLEVMNSLASRPGATEDLKTDMSVLYEWLGMEEGQTVFTTEQHETFARGFELYLREGNAPTIELKSSFQRFKSWLTHIYKTSPELQVQLTPEVRAVMGRMLTSETSIRVNSETAGTAPAFQSAEQMGVSEAAFAEYIGGFGDAMKEAEEEMLTRLMRELVVRETGQYKRTKKEISEKIAADVERRQVYIALQYFKTGVVLEGEGTPPDTGKMDRAQVKALFYGNPKILLSMPRSITKKNGSDIDLMARHFGYRTAHEMITAFTEVKPMKLAIREEVQGAMDAIYGDTTTDPQEIEKEARDALHTDKVGDFISKELKILAARGKSLFPPGFIASVRDAATKAVEGMTVSQLKSAYHFQQAEQKAAKKSMEMAAKEDWAAAAEYKKQQLMNYWLYRKATRAGQDIDSIYKYLRTFTTVEKQKKLGLAGGDYLESIALLLEGVDLKKISQAAVSRRKGLADYLAAMEAAGQIVLIPKNLRDASKLSHYTAMQLSEFKGLRDAVKNIDTLAKLKLKLQTERGKIDYIGAVTSMIAQVYANNKITSQSKKQDPGAWRKLRSMFRSADTDLLKVEFLIEQLEGSEPGPIHALLFQPIADAQKSYYDRLAKLEKSLLQPFKNITSAQRNRLNRKYDFLGKELSGYNVLAIALNWGNASNKEKFIDGYNRVESRGYTEENVMEAMENILVKEDFVLVQHIIDETNQFWPEIKDLHKRNTGLAPAKVIATPIVTKHGTWEGGYYPVMYDRTRDYQQNQNEMAKGYTNDIFTSNLMRDKVSKGFTEGRTTYTGPIDLDVQALGGHLNEVLFFLTHYDAISNVSKLIGSPSFRDALANTVGIEYHTLFKEWLHSIANDAAVTESELTVVKVMNHLTTGTSIMVMGLNLSTGLIQLMGVSSAVARIGPVSMVKGIRGLVSPAKWKFAFEQSREIAHMMKTFDRDARKHMDKMMLNLAGGKVASVRDIHGKIVSFAFMFIGAMQQLVNVSTFLGAYDRGIKKLGLEESDAVKYADSVMRKTQSAAGPKDMAKIQRDRALGRMMTSFYSYFSALYGLLREMGTPVGKNPIAWTGQFAALIFFPILIEKAIKEGLPAGDDETEEWLKEAGAGMVTYAAATVPGARDIASAMLSKYSYNFSPVVSQLGRGAMAVKKVLDPDKELTRKDFHALARAAGVSMHLPVNQIIKLDKYMQAYLDGNIEEPIREFTFGVKHDN